jgi:hypothetical protein
VRVDSWIEGIEKARKRQNVFFGGILSEGVSARFRVTVSHGIPYMYEGRHTLLVLRPTKLLAVAELKVLRSLSCPVRPVIDEVRR